MILKLGGIVETVVYIGGIEYHKRTTSSTTETKTYTQVMGGVEIREGSFSDDTTDPVIYTLSDHLSSATIRLDDNGTLIDKEEYYAFGDCSLRSFDKRRYRYCGKEKDNESGLFYYGARYYEAWTGRFINVDPLAVSYTHLTSFNYAGNNPVGDKDIDGMQTPSTEVRNGEVNNSTRKTSPNQNSNGLLSGLKIPKLKYSAKELEGAPNLVGDGQPGQAKASVNGAIELWNSTIDIGNKVAGAISHPINTANSLYSRSKRVANITVQKTKTAINYIKNTTPEIAVQDVKNLSVEIKNKLVSVLNSSVTDTPSDRNENLENQKKLYAILFSTRITGLSTGFKPETSCRLLKWGDNMKSHLVRHADVLGYGKYSAQELQKMIPQLKAAANELYNDVNPIYDRIRVFNGQNDKVIFHITYKGYMLVTKLDGEFITVTNKPNEKYWKAKSLL